MFVTSSQNVPLFLFSPVSITVKICYIGFCVRTCWGYCSCVRGGEEVFSACCPQLTTLLDGVPGAINALPPGCCLGVLLVWLQCSCGVAVLEASLTQPLWSKAHPMCAVQGCKMMENWGKCGFMFSCCQSSRSCALTETESSCSHTWTKTEKKEQVSYFTGALKKHLLML